MLLQNPNELSQSPFNTTLSRAAARMQEPTPGPTGSGRTENHGTTSYLYDTFLSPFYDRLTRQLWPEWLHPNYITLLGAVFCASAILAFGNNDKTWPCIGWTLYHMCDNMDGKQARRTNQTSRFGGFLDHAVDGLLGVYMGYIAVAAVVFDVRSGSALFHTGRHCFCLLWLTPHILCKLNPSQGLILGTKACSVDEGFLGVSALLFYHGWVSEESLFPHFENVARFVCHAIAATAIGAVMHGFSVSNHSAKRSWAALFFLLAVVGYATRESEKLWWALWVPCMMLSVAH